MNTISSKKTTTNEEWLIYMLSEISGKIYRDVLEACKLILAGKPMDFASFSINGLIARCEYLIGSNPEYPINAGELKRVIIFLITGSDGILPPCFKWRLAPLIQESFRVTLEACGAPDKIVTVVYNPECGILVSYRDSPCLRNHENSVMIPCEETPENFKGFPYNYHWVTKVADSIPYISKYMDEADAKAATKAKADLQVAFKAAAAKAAADAAERTAAAKVKTTKVVETEAATNVVSDLAYTAALTDGISLTLWGKPYQKRQEDITALAFDCVMQLEQLNCTFSPAQVQLVVNLYIADDFSRHFQGYPAYIAM
jgi:hypothetical protein